MFMSVFLDAFMQLDGEISSNENLAFSQCWAAILRDGRAEQKRHTHTRLYETWGC